MKDRLPVVEMLHADAQMVYNALLTESPMFGGFFTDPVKVFGNPNTIELAKIAFQVIDVELIDGVVYVEYKIFNTPMAALLKDLLAHNVKLGLIPSGYLDIRNNKLTICGLNIKPMEVQ